MPSFRAILGYRLPLAPTALLIATSRLVTAAKVIRGVDLIYFLRKSRGL